MEALVLDLHAVGLVTAVTACQQDRKVRLLAPQPIGEADAVLTRQYDVAEHQVEFALLPVENAVGLLHVAGGVYHVTMFAEQPVGQAL